MNAVEIEQAISDLALQPFDAAEFPFAFLAAFGNKDTTLKRLRSGNSNASDVPGGLLQRNHIHIATGPAGSTGPSLQALRSSPATAKAKARFLVAADGHTLEAEDRSTGETIACAYADFANHFGFFLPLAGISTIQEIKDNPIDVRATGRLNKLYVELLRENPAWATAERRADMNHFMARLIFCFFAEDTDIFNGTGLFTRTIEQFTERDGGNVHTVMAELFRAMNVKPADRAAAGLRPWADQFPYVNGGLFSGSPEVPRFTRMARSYLLHAGTLNWKQINPDIFGSMIQAVADDAERGELGMHYTSVPNILKVLNPLFLDDLRAQLAAAGDNKIKLLNLRKRLSRIRVFDPACGSGNFLVIAYKQMREIEAEINRRRGETHLKSEIPLTNFRGIELRDFPAEIARLALIIAEFQCDVLYRGQKDALAEFLPLDAENWIVCGNALRLDWLALMDVHGFGVKLVADDLFGTRLEQGEIEFESAPGETYICGNPPYVGSSLQVESQKADLEDQFGHVLESWRNLDYIAGWFFKAAQFVQAVGGDFAFVSTNSICQGQQVPLLWPLMFRHEVQIHFAHTSFKWSNLAASNAGVTVVIVGGTTRTIASRTLFSEDDSGAPIRRSVERINAYLVASADVIVEPASRASDGRGLMLKGNMPSDGGHLVLSAEERRMMIFDDAGAAEFIYGYCGSHELIHNDMRYCLWIEDEDLYRASSVLQIRSRLDGVRSFRESAKAATTRPFAQFPNRFRQIQSVANAYSIVVPSHSSEIRSSLPIGLLPKQFIVSNAALVIYDAPLWNLALIASRLHLVWIATVCGKLKTDFRYSNTLGWNTFPVPLLTEQNKADLTRCAENILLAREVHFPATIAELYDPKAMPENLRQAHAQNDEVLERIYIGRRFKNDTERLEKLFELYTKMTAAAAAGAPKVPPAKKATRKARA
ncbi:MAG: class I SAM-dependent DNA methyltransferase [Ideonella sp. WA131b]|nr:class I SAM-dependent DNA methyltransferase [Ideonella sp. WA131b]